MTPIPCPVCLMTAAPAATAGVLAICGACGASLHVDDHGVRRATAADTTGVSAAELKTLRLAHGRIARAEA